MNPLTLSPQNLRQFLSGSFKEISQRGDNVIVLTSNFSSVFERITSPNEFAGPLVEAWAHLQLSSLFAKYVSASAGGQAFADSVAEYHGQAVWFNIKAKSRLKEKRSRINLSSLQRYNTHYSQVNPASFYVLVFEYNWQPLGNTLKIQIEKLKYTFNLLEIPLENYKIEGAFEGSYRIFISPIPKSAETESTTYSIITAAQFLQRIAELRDLHMARKTSRTRN